MRQLTTLFSLILIVATSSFINYSHGQDSIKKITLKVRVTDVKGAVTNAYLHSVSDSGLFLSPTSSRVYSSVKPGNLTFVDANEINLVTMRKKNQVSNGLALGALAGGVAGIVLGLASSGGDSGDGFVLGAGGSAIVGGVGGAAIGGILGIACSLGSRKYKVRGDNGNYTVMRQSILSRITRKKRAASNASSQGIAGTF